MNPSYECNELYDEAIDVMDVSLKEAAEIFEEAAKCFDKKNNRKNAAHSYSLAGQLYLESDDLELAADCYGKSVIRMLILEDYKKAQTLIELGEENSFNTFHFRTARESLKRKIEENRTDKIIDELAVNELDETIEEVIELEDIELEKVLDKNTIDNIKDEMKVSSVVPVIMKGYEIKGDVKSNSVKNKRANVYANQIIEKSRDKIKDINIKTNVTAQGASGIQLIAPKKSLNPMRRSQRTIQNNEIESLEENNSANDDLEEIDTLEELTTLDTKYISTTEIDAEEELEDVEITENIPFSFNILEVKKPIEVKLIEKREDLKEGSLVYTWKIDKLKADDKIKIDYIMEKRVVRSIVAQIDEKMVLFNSYHSLNTKEEVTIAEIVFNNTTGKNIDYLMIEDIFPPELVVRSFDSNFPSSPPQKMISSDTIIYRWFNTQIEPNQAVRISYSFEEKPITRWYKEQMLKNDKSLILEKICQPIHHVLDIQYLVFYSIKTDFSAKLLLEEYIPNDYKILAIKPNVMFPKINNNSKTLNNQRLKKLKWKIELQANDHVKFVVRVTGSKIFIFRDSSVHVEGFAKTNKETSRKQMQKEVNLKDYFTEGIKYPSKSTN